MSDNEKFFSVSAKVIVSGLIIIKAASKEEASKKITELNRDGVDIENLVCSEWKSEVSTDIVEEDYDYEIYL